MIKDKKTLKKIDEALRTNNYLLAIEYINTLLKNRPSDYHLLLLRGEAYLKAEFFNEALTDLAKVVEGENKNVRALNNFSVALIRCNMQNDAKPVLEYVLELEPMNFDALINLCNIYQTIGRSEESLKLAIRAVEINPKSKLAYNNLGTAFGDLNMVKEAREALLIAHDLDPFYITSAINLGQIEVKLGRHLEAKKIFEELLSFENIQPSEANLVRYYLSYCYLHLGQISKGWDYYEFGYGSLLPVSALRSRRKFKQPQWNGERLVDKKLLIWREQGLGDEIEFSTCLTDVFETTSNVILECDYRLVDIYKRTFPSFEVRRESFNNDLYSDYDDFDVQCAIGSLPKIFRRDINSFNRKIIPLVINKDSINKFRNRLGNYNGKKLIGISWRSGLVSIGRNVNYTVLEDWFELLTQEDFQFVNLQYGECEEEILNIENSIGIKIIRWPDLDLKNDLENIYGLIKNLDAVVTVGTAVSSIAASCNIPTILLMKPSWLMLGEKNKYPWYESVIPLVADNDEHVAVNIKKTPSILRNILNI